MSNQLTGVKNTPHLHHTLCWTPCPKLGQLAGSENNYQQLSPDVLPNL